MRYFFVIGLLAAMMASCSSFSTFEMDELYGSWKGTTWEMTFEKEGKCKMLSNGVEFENCTYRVSGNTLEIASNGAVILTNLTVKGIEGDVMTLEFRKLGESKTHTLNRVK